MSEDRSVGPGWVPQNLIGVMDGMGLNPTPVKPVAGDDLRVIAATDPASQLHFGAVYLAQPNDSLSNLGFICMIPAAQLTPEDAEAINTRLPMALAFLEDGQLWIYVELNISRPFTEEFFRTQTEFFLSDMRTAFQILLGGGDMTFIAMNAFRAVKNRFGDSVPLVAELSNSRDPLGRPSRRGMRTVMAAPCPRCGGKGKRLLLNCSACRGTGEIR